VVFSPVAGFLGDKMSSRQLPFLIGLVALMLGTLLLFVGEAVWILAIARILQGVSGTVVWTVGMALCVDTVGPENLGKTVGSVWGPECCNQKLTLPDL
jgi:predicted MFS family arabinose efflux permease